MISQAFTNFRRLSQAFSHFRKYVSQYFARFHKIESRKVSQSFAKFRELIWRSRCWVLVLALTPFVKLMGLLRTIFKP